MDNSIYKAKIEIERAESELKSAINMLDECFTLDENRIQDSELNSILERLELESNKISDLINISGNGL